MNCSQWIRVPAGVISMSACEGRRALQRGARRAGRHRRFGRRSARPGTSRSSARPARRAGRLAARRRIPAASGPGTWSSRGVRASRSIRRYDSAAACAGAGPRRIRRPQSRASRSRSAVLRAHRINPINAASDSGTHRGAAASVACQRRRRSVAALRVRSTSSRMRALQLREALRRFCASVSWCRKS